eukprot:TRINITY_DN67971_c0_g1_i1.p1 TRINITY_DN67971_c0_g1~~TRINITY_DN67971_c0_g1_i1.p1  ORF type:complete len:196 (+),score=33.40 TRINITY_DN67971_c0_g1_i1:814-1401(+)
MEDQALLSEPEGVQREILGAAFSALLRKMPSRQPWADVEDDDDDSVLWPVGVGNEEGATPVAQDPPSKVDATIARRRRRKAQRRRQKRATAAVTRDANVKSSVASSPPSDLRARLRRVRVATKFGILTINDVLRSAPLPHKKPKFALSTVTVAVSRDGRSGTKRLWCQPTSDDYSFSSAILPWRQRPPLSVLAEG